MTGGCAFLDYDGDGLLDVFLVNGAAIKSESGKAPRIDKSEPYRLDPSGDEPLRLAKRVRRNVLRREGDSELREEAERHFGMPTSTLTFSQQLELPLYTPSR